MDAFKKKKKTKLVSLKKKLLNKKIGIYSTQSLVNREFIRDVFLPLFFPPLSNRDIVGSDLMFYWREKPLNLLAEFILNN